MGLRLTLRVWGVLLVAAVTAVMMVLRSASYTPPPELDALLTGCDTPCLLGIKPGETHIEEVATLLEQHPLVQDTPQKVIFARGGILQFRWELDALGFAEVFGEVQFDDDDIVTRVSVPIWMLPGDLWMILGHPDARRYSRGVSGFQSTLFYDVFADAALMSAYEADCPVGARTDVLVSPRVVVLSVSAQPIYETLPLLPRKRVVTMWCAF